MRPTSLNLVPTVIEKLPQGERAYDIFSRLLKDRIVFLSGEIDDNTASLVVAQLLFLQGEDEKADITMYISSPGGSVDAGLAIYDTMNHIKPDVATFSVGIAASMGAFLLAAGQKGKRYALPNSSILLHQPSGGFEGTASDISITAERILKLKKQLNNILSANTGQPLEKIEKDTERDFWMGAEEAAAYGVVDSVLK